MNSGASLASLDSEMHQYQENWKMEERELRRILQSVVADEHVPEEDAEEAATAIRDKIEEAKENGFNEAEAVKAILSPVFATRQF